jgi:hypothetical protein
LITKLLKFSSSVAALAKGIALNCTPRLAGKYQESAESAN